MPAENKKTIKDKLHLGSSTVHAQSYIMIVHIHKGETKKQKTYVGDNQINDILFKSFMYVQHIT